MKKKIITMISVLFVVFPFIAAVEVLAQSPPTVNDCLEKVEDCEEEAPPLTEDADETETIASFNDSNSLLFDLIKMFFALLLVLGLIYIMLKLLNKRNKMFNQIKHLENLGGISVGQNKSIQIIRIGDRFYVVGVGENVEMLHEITDEKMIEQLLEQGEEDPLSIETLIPSFLKQKSKLQSSDQGSRDFKNLFTNELDKLKKNRADLINHNKRKEDEQ
ncbi:flagellar biosynthetic protein FliO [Virgibacillus kimchii]